MLLDLFIIKNQCMKFR